jgi:hypothetical protein
VALPLGAAAALLVAGPASGAKGGKGPREASATATATGAFNIATATARCPSKTKAVAGGYTTSLPSMPNHWLNVYESQRVGQNQWRVSGVEYFPAPAADSLTAYVYCEVLKAKVRSVPVSVPLTSTPNGSTSVLALCPSGSRALSGGFVTPASNAADKSYVSRSTVVGQNGWVVDATNLAGATARTIFGYVYCAKLGKAQQRSASVAVLGPANSFRTVITPACPARTFPRGGGFATSTPVGGLSGAALVYETKRAGGSWTTSASASGNATSSTMVGTSLCR